MVEKKSLEPGRSASEGDPGRIAKLCRAIVASRTFDLVITGIIILQAITLAVEATPALFGGSGTIDPVVPEYFVLIHSTVVAVFIVEAGLRLAACYPRPLDYFRDGWNSFDFAIIVLSIMPITGQFATIARLIRLLRVTRLITKSRELRAIMSTLVSSIPSIFNILILLGMLFFIYAIVGYHLFNDVDPERWGSFPDAMMTMFQIITLEGWADIMLPVVSQMGDLYWLYFATFIVIGTFIVVNLFISVIVRKSEDAYRQLQLESGIPLTQQEIGREIREIRRILEELEKRIEPAQDSAPRTDESTRRT